MKNLKILSGLIGVCVGDALGVPVEFSSREKRRKKPVTEMTGYGTYRQPPGTWSDDASLTLCLAEALCEGFNLEAIARNFVRWYYEDYWTARGEVFDVGGTTSQAIFRLREGVPPTKAGGMGEFDNGNGSLMRILPLAFCYKTVDFPELIQRVHYCSSMTHAHLRSQIACGIYISIAICLLEGLEPKVAYIEGIKRIKVIYSTPKYASEMHLFSRILEGEIDSFPMKEISSDTYVLHSLEAALWCFLNASSYAEAVLKAVNLGGDTDTTAAITGGLAGIYYGIDNIPSDWIEVLARKDDIADLAERLEAAYG
ncbi:MAG: ADP-ribosylglycohydrolase family protein [Cyanobacteriota bacterium]|nr:ADP-ribosylglycohydrolase family protein [Cyanobacteriota bacterium]